MFLVAMLPPIQNLQLSLRYERSNFLETGDYAEAVAFCDALARANPKEARVVRFGKSPQGRDMVALIMSSENAFSGDAARRSKKPLVFINNGIHSGEIEGKDACLMMARDILISKKQHRLIEGSNLVLIPIFSVDAHERRSAYNRINQNGPTEMGWRATANNLNLNRDFIKADAPEMRNMLKLIAAWNPDFFFDNHTTDGSDYQYSVMLSLPITVTQDPALAGWARSLYKRVKATCDGEGFLTAPYFDLSDRADPTKPIGIQDFSPRYSTGYFMARNRPTMLVETHMLKPYKQRVEATYAVVQHTIETINSDAAALKKMIASADESVRPGAQVVLDAGKPKAAQPFTFMGFKYAPQDSPITGGKIAAWERTPMEFASMITDDYEQGLTIKLPAAYIIPAEWQSAINLVRQHGIQTVTLRQPMTGTFRGFRFEKVTFPRTPFEGRFQPAFTVVETSSSETLLAGSVVVPTQQPLGKLAAHMLDPRAPDSLFRWGFFNAVTEQKEYFEDYAMEPIARKMLDADPRLKAEFEDRLKDPAFAGSARARLDFFWQHSPYADPKLNRYPVVMQ